LTFLLLEINLKKQIYPSWSFHVDECSESLSTYDMIISRDQYLLGESGIIINFNDQKVTWDTDNVPMKNRDTSLYYQYRLWLKGIFEHK
jgi:hypothetical protein